ncbi:MAG TPA: sigma-70 family RNA polymerase sigma factor [Anaerolineae bacterium]
MSAENLLIGSAQGGDLQAFNKLVLMYQGLAYNVAYNLLGNADEAVDATQDSFVKAYQAIGRYWGGSFKAWLLRIVTNTCYDMLRSRRRHWARCASLNDMLERPESAAIMRDRAAGPQEQAENHELRQIIHQGIRALPVEQRTVVVLYDVEGFSYEEIARATGMPVGTVKSRLNRARTHLRDYLLAAGALSASQAAGFGAARPSVPSARRLAS